MDKIKIMDKLVIDPIDEDRKRYYDNSALKDVFYNAFDEDEPVKYKGKTYTIQSLKTTSGWNVTDFLFDIMNMENGKIEHVKFESAVHPVEKSVSEILTLRKEIKDLKEAIKELKKEDQMKGKKVTQLKQNKKPGFKESPKITRNKAIIETMSIMNMEMNKISKDISALMNITATILEVAELNGLFSAQDVIKLADANVKNSSVYKQVMAEMDGEKTDDTEGLAEILGKQLYTHNLGVESIRKDIIDFEKFYKGDDVDKLIKLAEKHRRELTSIQLKEDKEEEGDDNNADRS